MTNQEMAIVDECIRIIQEKIVRNGDTPENIRSRQHVMDIRAHFSREVTSEENDALHESLVRSSELIAKGRLE